MKVLFVNHSERQCGVYLFGKRVYDLSSKSKNVDYFYIEVNNPNDFYASRESISPDVILYNWYPITMQWLTNEMITSYKKARHFFIFHDGNMRKIYDKYVFSGDIGKDIDIPQEKISIIPRPLFLYEGDYVVNTIPTIGTHGFGGWHKGFTDLVEAVNREFETAIVNIHMPFAFFGDRQGDETLKIADACRKLNTNSGITLNITHDFGTDNETLKFLAGNDINVYLYKTQNQGLSSCTDYSLSVKRPIALSNDSMFKHIISDDIRTDMHTIKEILSLGTKPLDHLYTKWDTHNFHNEMDRIFYE